MHSVCLRFRFRLSYSLNGAKLPFGQSRKVSQTADSNCFVTKLPFSCSTDFSELAKWYFGDCFQPFRLKLKHKWNLRYFKNTKNISKENINLVKVSQWRWFWVRALCHIVGARALCHVIGTRAKIRKNVWQK